MYTPDTRTDQQKIDSLLEQYSHETNIEISHNNNEDIETKLASLKGQEMKSNEKTDGDNIPEASDSEEEVDKITKKVFMSFMRINCIFKVIVNIHIVEK